MQRCPEPKQLRLLLSDEVPPDILTELTSHLESCSSCQAKLDELAGGELNSIDMSLDNTIGAGSRYLDQAVEASKRPEVSTGTSGDLVDELLRSGFFHRGEKPEEIYLGNHKLIRTLGQGGMGLVVLAREEILERNVAIKILHPNLARDVESRKRFVREAKAAAAVDHDHIVTIYSVGEHANVPYIIMQPIPGDSLQKRVTESGPLPPTELVQLGVDVANGLSVAHKQQLIHRDIKPSNVILDESNNNRAIITDFGLAKSLNDVELTQSGVLAGTPQYMAPEQAELKEIDHRADLFSFGSLLYFAGTGKSPFEGDSAITVIRQVCDGQPTDWNSLRSTVSGPMAKIINRLMKKSPADRYQSADEVRADLIAINNVTFSAEKGDRTPRYKLIATGVLAVVLLVAASIFAWNSWTGQNQGASGDPSTVSGAPVRNVSNEKEFEQLSDAIASAVDGDTIEINQDGPILIRPIEIDGKSLVIRSADGARPILKMHSEFATQNMLVVKSTLELHGVEIEWINDSRAGAETVASEMSKSFPIVVQGGELKLDRCRLTIGKRNGAVFLRSGQCEVRNCQILSDSIACFYWMFGPNDSLKVENCLFNSRVFCSLTPLPSNMEGEPPGLAATNCTIVAESFIQARIPPNGNLQEIATSLPSAIQVTTQRNILAADSILDLRFESATHFNRSTGSDVDELVGALFTWRDEQNIYSNVRDFIKSSFRRNQSIRLNNSGSLQRWNRFWEIEASSSTILPMEFDSQHGVTEVDHYRVDALFPDSWPLVGCDISQLETAVSN